MTQLSYKIIQAHIKHFQDKNHKSDDHSLVATMLLPSGKPIEHGDMSYKLCKSLKSPIIWFQASPSIVHDICIINHDS